MTIEALIFVMMIVAIICFAFEYVLITWTRRLLDFIDGVFVTPGALSMYRKSAVQAVGGFDKNLLTEDIERRYRNTLTVCQANDRYFARDLKEKGACVVYVTADYDAIRTRLLERHDDFQTIAKRV